MGRIPQLVQHAPAPVGIRPRGSAFSPLSLPGIVAWYQPKGAASLAASYVNRANPGTFDAVPGVAPTWDAVNGWKGDGATTYLDTGITPTAGYSLLVRFSGDSSATSCVAGRFGDSGGVKDRLALFPRNGGNRYFFYGNNSTSTNVQVASGVMAVCGSNGFYNGVAEAAFAGVWAGTGTASTIYLLACNNAGTAAFFVNGYIQIAIVCSSILSDDNAILASTWMAAQ